MGNKEYMICYCIKITFLAVVIVEIALHTYVEYVMPPII